MKHCHDFPVFDEGDVHAGWAVALPQGDDTTTIKIYISNYDDLMRRAGWTLIRYAELYPFLCCEIARQQCTNSMDRFLQVSQP